MGFGVWGLGVTVMYPLAGTASSGMKLTLAVTAVADTTLLDNTTFI